MVDFLNMGERKENCRIECARLIHKYRVSIVFLPQERLGARRSVVSVVPERHPSKSFNEVVVIPTRDSSRAGEKNEKRQDPK